MGARYIPEKFKCSTARDVEDALGRAVLKRIRQLGLTAAELKQTYPSIRLGHLRKLENDEPLGYRMSCALLEATGLDVDFEVAA
jgi:hypothetical protein